MFEFFGKNAKIVSYDVYAQPIHMIMDRYSLHVVLLMRRMSGKTQSTCYVEFDTYSDAQRMVQRRNNRALGTRNVQLSIVPQEELMEAVFPRFRGEWRGVDPWIREVEEGQSGTPSTGPEAGEYMSRDGIVTGGFVSREEINSILTHAKTYRVCPPLKFS